ncbi:SpaA isopeptide-forming pilin-related protein [Collinsella tanakaei]|uniref:SpaA isopeptide-forming pilin-related protein n=1 Tax=Collinsella tanakaei TaxID=626935 RepID=UPI0025A44943|nr:SpaA isopeptide-forming pilin-related protein [Collinsella tanakaei]MDM8302538.1 SpaA isopeptide-forming pilin-related protein [Collinsella tanakaei]
MGLFTFRVDDKGQIVNESGEGYTVEDGKLTIVANDTPIEAKIVKTDKDGISLPGATFTITNTADADDVKTVTTDENGSFELDSHWLVAGNTYTIEETSAPDTYELAGKATFKVMDDGSIVFLNDDDDDPTTAIKGEGGSGAYLSTNDEGVAVITATDTGIAVQLTKVAKGGTPTLAGAVFELAENGAVIDTLELGDAGMTALPGLVAGHTYTLTETVAPAGFELNGTPYEFTVKADGTIEADDQAGYSFDGDATITITAEDTPIEVALNKADLGDELLEGAVFEIAGTFADGTGKPGDAAPRTLTLENGTITIENLIATRDGGTEYVYELTEKTAPAGYELVDPFRFTVDVDGNVVPVDDERPDTDSSGYDVEGDALTAHDTPVEAKLVKVDEADEPLPGAIFEITGTFAGDLADQDSLMLEATADDGTVTIPTAVLIAGNTYTVREVTAPAGYELAGTATFTVNADGTLTFTDADGDGSADIVDGTGTYVTDESDGVAVITATDVLAELTVSKINGESSLLPGATITLTEVLAEDAPEGAQPQSFQATTDETGTVTFTGLVAGTTYELAETAAPAGYERVEETMLVIVQPDGTVVAASDTTSPAFTIGQDGESISILNQQVGITLVKRDAQGHGLVGAEFTMTGEFPDGTAERTFVSDEYGVVFGELSLIGSAEGTPYVLTETKAPAGYELLAPVTILVFEDGTVAVDDSTTQAPLEQIAVSNDDATSMIAFEDTAIELTFTKTDAAGNALAGATFHVTGTFADGSTECTVVSSDDGTIDLPQLVAGETYTVEETDTPTGYLLIEGTFSFTVTEDGMIEAESTATSQLFGGWTAGYAVSDDGLTLTAINVAAPDEQLPGDLPTTGDSARFVGLIAAAGVVLLGAGLAYRHRRKFADKR